MAHYPLIKTTADDEDVCEVCLQCASIYYKVVEGTTKCPKHGGARQEHCAKNERAMQYRVEVWNRRLKEFSNANEVKSLREEIGILRILMEETMRKCQTPGDLLMFSARIQTLANDIQRLVSACDKLEKSMGEMMDRPTAIKFASKLIDVVASEITDSEILDNISHKIIEEIR